MAQISFNIKEEDMHPDPQCLGAWQPFRWEKTRAGSVPHLPLRMPVAHGGTPPVISHQTGRDGSELMVDSHWIHNQGRLVS